MAAPNPFDLADLANLCRGAWSRWARILPRVSPQAGGLPIHPLLRGLLSLQLGRKLQHEGVIRDLDMQEGIMALSAVGGVFDLVPEKYLNIGSINELITHSASNGTVVFREVPKTIEVDVLSLVNSWDGAFPVQPENGIIGFEPRRWNAWMDTIVPQGAGLVAARQAGNAPPGINPQPIPGELHPWACAMFIDVDVSTGQATNPRVGEDLAVLEALLVIGLFSPRSAVRRSQILNSVVLGVTILTSGGNITNAQVRKAIRQARQETMDNTIDFTRDMVLRGWDFLSAHWQRAQKTGADFETMFQLLENATQPFSLRLALMYQQTEFKMLTPIVTTIRAINRFRDFPWDNLFDLINLQTGTDEQAAIVAYGNYITAQSTGPGGHWAGWEFALREQGQHNMKVANFVNCLYAALQLTIQIGGTIAMRQYKGLDNHTVPLKDIIDNWIAQYAQVRVGAAADFQLVNPNVAPSPALQNIRAFQL